MRVRTWQVALAGLVLVGGGLLLAWRGDQQSTLGQDRLSAVNVPAGSSWYDDNYPGAADALAAYDLAIFGDRQAKAGKLTAAAGGALVLVSFLLAVSRANSSRVRVGGRTGHAPATAPPVHHAAPAAGGVPRAPCPTCGESIAVSARVCRFCGRDTPSRAPEARA